MKKTRLPLLFLSLLLLLCSTAMLSYADAEEETALPQETVSRELASGEASSEGQEDPEAPKGFLGAVNTYLSLCEGGGLVTRTFGTYIPAKYGEHTGKVLDVPVGYYVMTILLCGVFSYVLGSVNFGIIVTKKMFADDVRNHGSGNAGMTNVLRTYGKKAAALTFLGDAGKAAVCAAVGLVLGGNGCGYAAVAFCMIGHAFPVFFKFKGGKSVAAVFGGLTILEPIATVGLFLVFLTIVLTTKYVSLGAMISASLIPVVVSSIWNMQLLHNVRSFDYFIVCICTVFYACFIVWLHRGNIKRLYNKEERKLEFSKKNKKKEENK